MNNQAAKIHTVVGMGLTGLSCAHYFAAQGIPFRVVDSRETPAMLPEFEQSFPDIELRCGEFDEATFTAADVLVVSPGMSLEQPEIKKALAAGAELSSDIEIFMQAIDKPVVAITGSNGKSTVTTLVGEMLEITGLEVCVAGNIGLPVLEQLLDDIEYDVYVLELSSFQLERLQQPLQAKAATILNVTEDHMDRYNGFSDYCAAKQVIYQKAGLAVVNRDDVNTETDTVADVIRFGLSESDSDFGLRKDRDGLCITWQGERLIAADELKIKGSHNLANVMAALALCRPLVADFAQLLPVLREFSGLKHRCQWVADVDGVAFYNDSKATNVGAAVAAITGLASVRHQLFLIAGGQDKDSDFEPLAVAVKQAVSRVFLIGQDADKIEAVLENSLCERCENLDEAIRAAYQQAEAGDIVLFAPACASFDMFKNYEARGECFIHAVEKLVA